MTENKHVKIVLRNGYKYAGQTTKVDKDSITIYDDLSQTKITIFKHDISTITEVTAP